MQAFKKEERLSDTKKIESLVKKGNSFSIFPLKILWKMEQMSINYPVQLAISVPKKIFKRAVDRNKIKRRIREVYRKSKKALYEHLASKNIKITLLLIYSDKQIAEYKTLEIKMAEILQQLIKKT